MRAKTSRGWAAAIWPSRSACSTTVGGFDAQLTACEDVDLCNRLRQAGHRIVADPAMRNVHYGDPSTLTALFFGELWRGRDNLQRDLPRPEDISAPTQCLDSDCRTDRDDRRVLPRCCSAIRRSLPRAGCVVLGLIAPEGRLDCYGGKRSTGRGGRRTGPGRGGGLRRRASAGAAGVRQPSRAPAQSDDGWTRAGPFASWNCAASAEPAAVRRRPSCSARP